jgi:tetratricopeptide (TPR) repeat protein
VRAHVFRLHLLLALALATGPARAAAAAGAASGGDAAVVYRTQPYATARAALERLTAEHPADGAACYYLGLTLLHHGGPRALDEAEPWLAKAVRLGPAEAAWFADYGGVCLKLADRERSLDWALRGRDALERAAALDPGDLASREALVLFYGQAPWPVGNTLKARTHAAEIGRRDPARGARAWVSLGRLLETKGDAASARAAYRRALELEPGNAAARAAVQRIEAAR